jgi:hypothetical protein
MKNILKILVVCLSALAFAACSKGSGQNDAGNQIDTAGSFTKNVLLMEFVSFDCVYCPKVSDVLKETADTKYPGRVDVISVHGKLEEDDPMQYSNYKPLQNYFYGVTGYPGIIIDQRDDLFSVGSFDATSAAFVQQINKTSNIGIAITTAVTNDNTVKVDVTIANKGEASDNYRLAVAVLENDIPYKQADLVDGSKKWIDNYRHSHVLRAILSNNYFGDALGTVAKNGQYTKTFSYTIPAGYVKNNLSFVAYVIEAKGFSYREAVNSRIVAIGKSIDLSGKIY